MNKKKLGSNPFVYPMPATIIGADVSGKANFMTIAYCGVVNNGPAMIAIGSNPGHYTMKGIEENGTFSVNIPSIDMVDKTDFVGIYSGEKIDKSNVFSTFYGELGTAPMISKCPVNLECKVVKRLDIGGMDSIVIGEVVQSYCNGDCITGKVPDISKIDPIIYATGTRDYWRLGEKIANAWDVGKELE